MLLATISERLLLYWQSLWNRPKWPKWTTADGEDSNSETSSLVSSPTFYLASVGEERTSNMSNKTGNGSNGFGSTCENGHPTYESVSGSSNGHHTLTQGKILF